MVNSGVLGKRFFLRKYNGDLDDEVATDSLKKLSPGFNKSGRTLPPRSHKYSDSKLTARLNKLDKTKFQIPVLSTALKGMFSSERRMRKFEKTYPCVLSQQTESPSVSSPKRIQLFFIEIFVFQKLHMAVKEQNILIPVVRKG